LSLAIDLINSHFEENLSISSLCGNTGLSESSMQYASQKRFQVSPKAYIKAIKLNKVTEDLLRRDGQMISTIAVKYGFWHMGQFAADYKKWFGELPSQTL